VAEAAAVTLAIWGPVHLADFANNDRSRRNRSAFAPAVTGGRRALRRRSGGKCDGACRKRKQIELGHLPLPLSKVRAPHMKTCTAD
jgi:hypothetical protein